MPLQHVVELALHEGIGPGHADKNANLAREHLAHTWGLYVLGGNAGGRLLWATGRKGDSRQQCIGKHETAGKWAKGTDAVARLVALGLANGVHKLPKVYGLNRTMRGVPIPLDLLEDAQVPSDAPCDYPPGTF